MATEAVQADDDRIVLYGRAHDRDPLARRREHTRRQGRRIGGGAHRRIPDVLVYLSAFISRRIKRRLAVVDALPVNVLFRSVHSGPRAARPDLLRDVRGL
jgi:hypothetical protein